MYNVFKRKTPFFLSTDFNKSPTGYFLLVNTIHVNIQVEKKANISDLVLINMQLHERPKQYAVVERVLKICTQEQVLLYC